MRGDKELPNKTVLQEKLKLFRAGRPIARVAKETGLPQQSWDRWERLGNRPRLDQLQKLVAGTGIRLEYWANDDIDARSREKTEAEFSVREPSPEYMANRHGLFAAVKMRDGALYRGEVQAIDLTHVVILDSDAAEPARLPMDQVKNIAVEKP